MGRTQSDPNARLFDMLADFQRRLRALETFRGGGRDYTPTWVATGTDPTLGNGTAVGRWFDLGGWITGWFRVTAGSTTTFGTGTYEFGLPVAIGGFQTNFGQARIVDVSAGPGFSGFLGSAAAAQSVRIALPSAVTSGAEVEVGQVTPFTAASGDIWGGAFGFQRA